VALLNHIYGLLDNGEKSRLIWLHGTAGVGKSAVAFTVAERMRGLKVVERTTVEKRLAATFFFSRKHTQRCTTGYFFATLAYQLACNFPSIREDVNTAIRENPGLLHHDKSPHAQMEALFLRPLRELRFRLRGCPPLVFVIDALDECTSETEIADLIALLGHALHQLDQPDLPVIHILLTSRSEARIREAMHGKDVHSLVCEIPVKTSGKGITTTISLDGTDVDNDIYIFLEHSFRMLQSRHPGFPLPTTHQLARLASRAGRRFVVASTMIKFIDDEYNDPRDRLQLMLDLTSNLLPGTEVYKLYDRILSTCADPRRAYLHLSIVSSLADPLPISQISTLLGPGEGKDVESSLIQLRSVMDVPTDSSLPVNIHHSSVRDYVSDPSNCSLLEGQHITSPDSLLARSSLRLMVQDMPESTAFLDAFSALSRQGRAMRSHNPQRLQHSLSFVVLPPEPLQILLGLLWLRGGRRSNPYPCQWLETLDGHAWLQTRKGKNWLQTGWGRDWLWNKGGQDWLQRQGGQAWLQTRRGKHWLQTQDGRAWLRKVQGGHDWLQTRGGQIWLQTLQGQDWLQTQDGRGWLQTPVGGQEWLQMQGGQEWLQVWGGQEWLQTRDGQWWLQSKGGQEWLQTIGQWWLQTNSGTEWLDMDGQGWLQTQGGKGWLQTEGGQGWVQTRDGQHWLQTEAGQDWLHMDGQNWLHTLDGRDWLHTQAGNVWLRTWDGKCWLRTRDGKHWLQTRDGQCWLQSEYGQHWLWPGRTLTHRNSMIQLPHHSRLLQTAIIYSGEQLKIESEDEKHWFWDSSNRKECAGLEVQFSGGAEILCDKDWLQTTVGQDWLQTTVGQDWLQTKEGRDWVLTQHGQGWVQTKGGQDWLRTKDGQGWLRSQTGQEWLHTKAGQEWLQTQGGGAWLQTDDGYDWVQTKDGRDWLQTKASMQDWLQTQGGQAWLQTMIGQDWLQAKDGKDWLQTHSGQDWLQTRSGRNWLQTERGQVWLQTSHGQAWQSTPSASVWVTMEEFSTTLEGINEYTITQELDLLPTFQVIQQFKSLPDFLVLPVFLALRYQDQSFTSALPQAAFPSNVEVVRAMKTFVYFAKEAQEQSQIASAALRYACQNWAVHLSRTRNPWDDTLNHIFKTFWDHHLLSWLERQWCLKGLQSCLVILSEGQKLAKVCVLAMILATDPR
jgi:hypothetical protein